MKKSIWIELLEWMVFTAVALFIAGVVMMRSEITSSTAEGSTAPVQSLEE